MSQIPFTGRPRLLTLWALLLAVAALPACDGGGEITDPDDLDVRRLFATPTEAEIQAVEADWAARANPARDARIEAEGMQDSTATVYVVAHTQTAAGGGDFTHHGLVRIPVYVQQEPPVPLAVVVYHHAGTDGLRVSDFLATLDLYPTIRDEAIVVAPVYRSETLTADAAGLSGNYTAGGTPSPWDYDVDDAIGLLNAALELFPDETDETQVGALGFDRGGNTALLHAVRDDRVNVVVEYFGPADFFNTTAAQGFAGAIESDSTALDFPGIPYLLDAVFDPLLDGMGSYDDARLDLLRRSPGFFGARLPDTQVHHHRSDPVVPVQFSVGFAERIAVSFPPEEQFSFDPYTNTTLPPGVESYHDPEAMPESLRDAERFIVRHITGEAP